MLFFIIIILSVVIDQLSKFLVIQHIKPLRTLPIIEDVFHFTYAENRGAAFSILQGRQGFLISVTIVFTLFLIYYLIKTPFRSDTFLFNLSLSFIIGGAIGNLIDRIRLQYVVDFLDFRLINFAIFNIADTFVVVGTTLLAILLLFTNTDHILSSRR